jgi:dimethylamine monooxygenase subunit A
MTVKVPAMTVHGALDMQVDWQRLFPNEDYRFHMGLRPGDPFRFFQPAPNHSVILAERCHWLDSHPDEHAALEPDGVDLLNETIDLAIQLKSIPPAMASTLRSLDGADPLARCIDFGKQWEPDFLLLREDPERSLRLVGGVVCFPSGWALREKLGLDVTTIHGVVPRLNETLNRQIRTFFQRLPPGVAWERENWGLAGSPDLNRHPHRALPMLNERATWAHIWVRIEHQLFLRLQQIQGVLFGIRVTVHPLAEAIGRHGIARGLLRALATMPPEVLAYKGLTAASPSLIRHLGSDPGQISNLDI